MPVTKTAKRALRGSQKKQLVNQEIRASLEKAERKARKTPNLKTVSAVFSIADRAVKKNYIHKNKAAHIKSAFSKLLGK